MVAPRCAVSLLVLVLVVPSVAHAQAEDDLRLPVELVVESMDEDDPFTRQQLEDALTVVIAGKPGIRLVPDSGADGLILYVVSSCLARACNQIYQIYTHENVASPVQPPPRPLKALYWDTGQILTGPRSKMLQAIREGFGGYIDGPIANWLRQSDRNKHCWLEKWKDTGTSLQVDDPEEYVYCFANAWTRWPSQ